MFEKNLFEGRKGFKHGDPEKIGILLINLGTPDAPTKEALKPYLKQFLWDKRIIELSRPFWWLILNGIILNTRPKKSAALYQKIWTKEGSPLLVYTRNLAQKLQQKFEQEKQDQFLVEFGMAYGNPSLKSALGNLKDKGMTKLLVIPLYPQYSGTTTASALDGLFSVLKTWRFVPELRTINTYYDHPLYISALVDSVKAKWAKEKKGEKLFFSYHGIPQRYFDEGDPYYCHCQKTSRLVTEQLGLSKNDYIVAFQSLFGKEEWIKPTTDKTIKALAKSGVKSLDVICPGFSMDCLETIDEIDQLNREIFLKNGGESFQYIPCLNDTADHLELFAELVREHTEGWKIPSVEELKQTEKRAVTVK